ncbi:MAG: amidohydrolase family protein [Planctomycetes bacterium]|nr:amidohydrolase family protein [Planctomycetota bacterium]
MYLGLDLGTTNIKALLVDTGGKVAASSSVTVGLKNGPNGAVEQDIGEIRAAVLKAICSLGDKDRLAAVREIGVSSQGGSLQITGANGAPIGPVISWLDGRGQPYDEAFNMELGREWFARHVGHGGSDVAVGQLLRLRKERPELLARPNRVGFVGDFIVASLCGRAAHDASSLSIATLLNPQLRAADPDLLKKLKLDGDQLPALLSPRECASVLSAEVARQTHLPAGTPVSAAVHDQYAAALGSAAVHAGDVMVGTGTAWVLLAVTDRLMPPVLDSAFVSPHPAEGLYGQLASLGNGGAALSWLVKILELDETVPGAIENMLKAAPAGCDGLRCRPFLAYYQPAGLPANVNGCFTGLKLFHTRAHLVRAVVEGLACELARHLRLLNAAGLETRRLILCGEAAAGEETPQTIADITGLPVACAAVRQTSAFGAAVIARGLAEHSESLVQLAESMASSRRIFTPGDNAARYRQIMAEYIASLPAEKATEPAASAGRVHLHHVFDYTDVDRAFWAEHLEDWLPKKIIDVHMHVSDPANRREPMTEEGRRQYWVSEVLEPMDVRSADRCLATVFPGRQVECVAMSMPSLEFDIEAENEYVRTSCLERDWHGLLMLRPQMKAADLDAALGKPGIIGVKPYYTLISRNPLTRDEHIEASIFDFLPHHVLEVLNARRAWVTLHVPKAGRLGHPDNIREIKEIRRRYPRVILVVAHLGRCYTEPHAQEALPLLADDPGLYFDNSAVLNPAVHRLALKCLGPDRILYGSDNPVFFMRGRRQWQGKTYINRTNYPFFFNKRREPPEIEAGYTLYMYEALLAVKIACRDAGLTGDQVNAIFHDNAERLIRPANKGG